MAKTHWIILFATFLLSCISIALLIVSFTTTSWVLSEASSQEATIRNSKISYGLFSGLVEINVLASPSYADVTLTCSYGDNICYYSCQNTVQNRESEMNSLKGGAAFMSCPTRNTPSPSTRQLYSSSSNITNAQTVVDTDVEFFGAGLFLTIVIFLALTMTFAVISAIFSIINVLFNPVDSIFNTFGLYIWNGIAIGFAVLVLSLYGALFGAYLSENIAITDTLRKVQSYSSSGLASLGYSYWIMIGIPFIHAINIGLVFLRQYLVDREPAPKTMVVAVNDAVVMSY